MSAGKKNAGTTEKGSGWSKIVAACIVLLLAAAITVICIFSPSWFGKGKGDNGDNTGAQVIAISDEGDKLYAGGTYTMPKAMTIVAAAPKSGDFAPSGEITISATVDNEYINGLFNFECEFPADSPEWANDKEASDYISLTPVSPNQVKVKLLAPFGAPIEIKATLMNTDSCATCRVDYLQRIEKYSLGTTGNDFGDDIGIEYYNLTYGIGTVRGDIEFVSGWITIRDNFEAAVKSYLNFDVKFKSYSLNKSQDKITIRENSGEFEVENMGYSAFIVDFDNFDERHKEAIYYAWHTAFISEYTGYGYYNTLIDVYIDYSYHGVSAGSISESEYIGGFISGSSYADGLSPDVNLDGGITF